MGFTLSHLFKAFHLYEQKGGKGSVGAVKNLVTSYKCNEDVTDAQCLQLIDQLEHDNYDMGDLALLTMRQLCRRENNAFKLLYHDILKKFLYMLELETTEKLHEGIGLTMEKVLSYTGFSELWIDQMQKGGLTIVTNHAGPDYSSNVQYACGQALKALAYCPQLVPLIIDRSLSVITNFKNLSSNFQMLYTEIIGKLMELTDEQNLAKLNVEALPAAIFMLQQGPCGPQKQSLNMFTCLASTDAGISAIVSNHVIPYIISAVVDSHCRRVRETGLEALSSLTGTNNTSLQKQILLQIDLFYHEDDGDEIARVEDVNKPTVTSKAVLYAEDKMQRGVVDLSRSLYNVLIKEGRMERDLDLTVNRVHITPCIDTDPCMLNTLTNAVTVLGNLASFQVNRVKVMLEDVTEVELVLLKQIRKKCHKVNHTYIKLFVEERLLCMLDLLYIYTRKLEDVFIIETLNNLNKTNKALASSQPIEAWVRPTSAVGSSVKPCSMDITSIFDNNEVKLISALLNTVQLFTWCSSHNLNKNLEESVQVKIDERCGNNIVEINPEDAQIDKVYKKEKTCHNCGKPLGQSIKIYSAPEFAQLNCRIFCQKCYSKNSRMIQHTMKKSRDSKTLYELYVNKLDGELKAWRRAIRIALYNNGVVESVGPWLISSNIPVQTQVLSILQHLVQPLSERVTYSAAKKSRSSISTNRPASSMTQIERERAMNVALHRMSSKMKEFIQDALGDEGFQASSKEIHNKLLPKKNPLMFEKCHTDCKNVVKDKQIEGNDPWEGRGAKREEVSEEEYMEVEDYEEDEEEKDSNLIIDSDKKSEPKSPNTSRKLGKQTTNYHRYERTGSRPESGSSKVDAPNEPPRMVINRAERPTSRSSSRSGKSKSKSKPFFNAATPRKVVNSGSNVSQKVRPHSASIFARQAEAAHGQKVITRSLKSARDNKSSPVTSSVVKHKSDRQGSGHMDKENVNSTNADIKMSKRKLKRFRPQWLPWKPSIDSNQAVAEQCRRKIVDVCGVFLIQELFAKDELAKRGVLNFLEEYIKNGKTADHMKISEVGIMPKLVDFLRVNDESEVLCIMSLSLVQKLVQSDTRLKQLFHHHGGSQLLLAMASYTSGLLREEVGTTLQSVSAVDSNPKPLERLPEKKPIDIWDHVMYRWDQEDQVTTLLQQFSNRRSSKR